MLLVRLNLYKPVGPSGNIAIGNLLPTHVKYTKLLFLDVLEEAADKLIKDSLYTDSLILITTELSSTINIYLHYHCSSP